jgi:hypothetical protein
MAFPGGQIQRRTVPLAAAIDVHPFFDETLDLCHVSKVGGHPERDPGTRAGKAFDGFLVICQRG